MTRPQPDPREELRSTNLDINLATVIILSSKGSSCGEFFFESTNLPDDLYTQQQHNIIYTRLRNL